MLDPEASEIHVNLIWQVSHDIGRVPMTLAVRVTLRYVLSCTALLGLLQSSARQCCHGVCVMLPPYQLCSQLPKGPPIVRPASELRPQNQFKPVRSILK